MARSARPDLARSGRAGPRMGGPGLAIPQEPDGSAWLWSTPVRVGLLG